MSGQLAKNVTEAKMLHSALMEISKQRYNFMQQSDWIQKRFLEAQRKKTTVMKDLLKNVNLNQIKTISHEKISKNDNAEEDNLEKQVPENKNPDDVALPHNSRALSAKTGSTTRASKLYAFVTERGSMHSSSIHSRERANDYIPSVNTEEIHIKQRRNSRWPVKDARFLRLHESLSDVYHASPKVALLESTISSVSIIT